MSGAVRTTPGATGRVGDAARRCTDDVAAGDVRRCRNDEDAACCEDAGCAVARPRRGQRMRAAVVGLTVVVASACQAPADRFDGPYPKVDAANAVAPDDDRAEGQHYFFFETWGAHESGQWPPADFVVQLMEDEPDVFGDQLAGFGFLPDVDDVLPIGLKRAREDDTKLHETCAMCHVAPLPDGGRWIGLPNLALDVSRLRLLLDERWVEAGHEPVLSDDERATYAALGPGEFDPGTKTSGPVPSDFPNYFHLGERTALNYLGAGKDVRSEAAMAIYAFGAGQKNAAGAEVPFPSDEKLAAFTDFLGALDPPAAPPQDDALVQRGRDVFATARCDACHHTDDVAKNGVTTWAKDGVERMPGDDDAFPRGSIATDVAHFALQDESVAPPKKDDVEDEGDDGDDASDDGLFALVLFIVTHGFREEPTDGYRVADLHALWATPPYLHNGSVPTLADLLRPAALRPTTVERGGVVLPASAPGRSNAGHEFGTDLSADDKDALIAFLLSL